jgi:hypothetical protein
MVSKAVCTSAQGAIDYFEDHLNVADYFVEGEKVDRGQFVRKVAERLGLDEAVVTREKFVAFVECDMKGLGADSKRQRVSEIKYIEFTYSPPKAVSVVAALDDRVKVARTTKNTTQMFLSCTRWCLVRKQREPTVLHRWTEISHRTLTQPRHFL